MQKKKKHKYSGWLYGIAAIVLGWVALVLWFLLGCGSSSVVVDVPKGGTTGTGKGGSGSSGSGSSGSGSSGSGSVGGGSTAVGGGGGATVVSDSQLIKDVEYIKELLISKGSIEDCGCLGERNCACK